MFNPVHHHCHPFTDFYKGLTCVEPKPLLTARKSDTLILWRACLLVVPAGLNPRTYNIGTLQTSTVLYLFLLQFSFSKVSVTSGLFSSKIRPCCNLLKCCSHSAIAIFIFLCICACWEINCVNKYQKLLFIGLSLCLIMSSNCSTFCIGNFCVVRNPFAIAFLYTSI